MNALKVFKTAYPKYFEDISTKSDMYEVLRAMPLKDKKNAYRAYLRENRRLRDVYRAKHNREAPCTVKRTFCDNKVDYILYKRRRDVVERLQMKRDQRCALKKIIKIPKGVEMHHVDRKMDKVVLLEKRDHIQHHKEERRAQAKREKALCKARLFEF